MTELGYTREVVRPGARVLLSHANAVTAPFFMYV